MRSTTLRVDSCQQHSLLDQVLRKGLTFAAPPRYSGRYASPVQKENA